MVGALVAVATLATATTCVMGGDGPPTPAGIVILTGLSPTVAAGTGVGITPLINITQAPGTPLAGIPITVQVRGGRGTLVGAAPSSTSAATCTLRSRFTAAGFPMSYVNAARLHSGARAIYERVNRG
jgi:hypothetical protein